MVIGIVADYAPASASRLAQDDPVAACAQGVQLFINGQATEAGPLLESGFVNRIATEFVDEDDLGMCALALAVCRRESACQLT